LGKDSVLSGEISADFESKKVKNDVLAEH